MKSLILTILYLAKDTVHRWFTRISSPLARILVVFFLSLFALCALGSYAISTKIVRDKIVARGGNLVFVNLTYSAGSPVPTEKEISDLLDADSYALNIISSAAVPGRNSVSVYSYDFNRSAQMLPLLATSGIPTLLEKPDGILPPGPGSAKLGQGQVDIFIRHLPADHLLLQLLRQDGIIIQPDKLPFGFSNTASHNCMLVVRLRHLESAADIQRVEQFFRDYIRLGGEQGNIISAIDLLGEMDLMLSKQTQCRLAFCLGISGIVGILLTALAGMEYRQNEYIYTLMKSFGIHPLLLVGAFITENIIIVGLSFVGAVVTFMYCQQMIVEEILKLGSYSLALQEIMPEIRLIACTLLGCIVVSSLPIMAAANREIGRVLK